ncbi:hypothetical protein [Hydrogenispora ethanolica]|uniref:hypothetical protein n=1 Tax=Hydrogenispora ethanolica TaxID=1082276 RepID=UPI0010529967|nr:hypothetical protein [Hydrogenispora ethanolica]
MKPGGYRPNEVDAGLFHIEKNSRKIYGAVEYIYRVDAISVCELWTGLPEVLGGGRSLLWVVYFILKRLQNLI